MNSALEGVGNTAKLPAGCRCVQGVAPQFAYHDDIDVESAQQGHFTDKVIPLNGLSSEPYEFVLEPMADYFIDLNSAHLYTKVQVMAADGKTAVGDKTAVTDLKVVDNLHSSMWRMIETKVNNVTIHPESASSHPYRAQMEYLLSVEKENLGSFTTTGFAATDDEFKAKQHKAFDLCGPVALDILRVNKHLAPGNKLSLTFHRSPHNFVLQVDPAPAGNAAPTAYKLKVLDIALYVNRIRLRPDVLAQTLGGLTQPQHYLTSHTEVKDFPVASSISQSNLKLYSGGVLPHQVVVGFVETEALTGSYTADPLKFQHFDLDQVCLRVNGVRLPQDPLEPDGGEDARTLLHLYQNTGKYRVNGGNSITADTFKTEHFLIPFDLTPDQCNNFHRHAGRTGSLDLELAWSKPLPKPITVVVLSVFNQVIQLRGEVNAPAFSLY